MKPRLLDLYCGVGGASMGYYLAGFDVTGVDHVEQPHYPFPSIQMDALDFIDLYDMNEYDAIHASPPCQAYSVLRRANPHSHYADLVAPTREALRYLRLPYVIENVPGAPLHDPVMLCGSMFGLGAFSGDGKRTPTVFRQLRRHRLFEASFPIPQPECRHEGREALGVYGGASRYTFGNRRKKDPAIRRGGYQGDSLEKAVAMDIDWPAWRDEINQAIPPVYTEYIGHFLIAWTPISKWGSQEEKADAVT